MSESEVMLSFIFFLYFTGFGSFSLIQSVSLHFGYMQHDQTWLTHQSSSKPSLQGLKRLTIFMVNKFIFRRISVSCSQAWLFTPGQSTGARNLNHLVLLWELHSPLKQDLWMSPSSQRREPERHPNRSLLQQTRLHCLSLLFRPWLVFRPRSLPWMLPHTPHLLLTLDCPPDLQELSSWLLYSLLLCQVFSPPLQ